jgi:coenzyme F420-reducing hydrogenase delta subunit
MWNMKPVLEEEVVYHDGFEKKPENKTMFSSSFLLTQLLISQAVLDSNDFKILTFDNLDKLKKVRLIKLYRQSSKHKLQELLELGDHITHLSKSIELENRIKNISKSLENVNLKNSRNSVIYLQNQRQRNEHKIKLMSNQLEKMKQREIEIKKTLLQHTAGVLNKGIQHLELHQNTSNFKLESVLDQVSRRISHICTRKLNVPVNSNASPLQKLLQLQEHLSVKSPNRYRENIMIHSLAANLLLFIIIIKQTRFIQNSTK